MSSFWHACMNAFHLLLLVVVVVVVVGDVQAVATKLFLAQLAQSAAHASNVRGKRQIALQDIVSSIYRNRQYVCTLDVHIVVRGLARMPFVAFTLAEHASWLFIVFCVCFDLFVRCRYEFLRMDFKRTDGITVRKVKHLFVAGRSLLCQQNTTHHTTQHTILYHSTPHHCTLRHPSGSI